jgi:phosphoribosylanthranilate isomerase
VDPAAAGPIVDAVRGRALAVGVFVDEPAGEIASAVRSLGLDAVQLSGDEPAAAAALLPFRLVKAVRLKPGDDLSAWAAWPCEALLLDAHREGAYGGTGVALDWKSLPPAVAALRKADGSPVRWMLAGGLTPGNVREAIVSARPSGVDTASGVESEPGRKDLRKMADFIQNAKEGFSIAGI